MGEMLIFRNLRLLDPAFDAPRGGHEVLVDGARVVASKSRSPNASASTRQKLPSSAARPASVSVSSTTAIGSGLDDEVRVDVDGAEIVDQHAEADALRIAQDAPEQGRLAGAE